MHLIHSSPACAVKTTVIMLQCVAAVAAALTADDRALLRAKAGVYASPERAYVVGGAAARTRRLSSFTDPWQPALLTLC